MLVRKYSSPSESPGELSSPSPATMTSTTTSSETPSSWPVVTVWPVSLPGLSSSGSSATWPTSRTPPWTRWWPRGWGWPSSPTPRLWRRCQLPLSGVFYSSSCCSCWALELRSLPRRLLSQFFWISSQNSGAITGLMSWRIWNLKKINLLFILESG